MPNFKGASGVVSFDQQGMRNHYVFDVQEVALTRSLHTVRIAFRIYFI